MRPETGLTNELLALAVENAQLREQLAEAQEHLVEVAVDAGALHADLEALKAELAEMRVDRDAWRAEAERWSEGHRTTSKAWNGMLEATAGHGAGLCGQPLTNG